MRRRARWRAQMSASSSGSASRTTGASGASRQKHSTRSRRTSRDLARRTRGLSLQQMIDDLAPYLIGWRGYFGRRLVCSRTWKRGSAEDYGCIFGGNGRTGPTASRSSAAAACRSSLPRSPPVHPQGSGACQAIPRSSTPFATTCSTPSVSPVSMFLPKLNSVVPPRYGSVCQVVWEGRCREAPPYPDLRP